MIRRAKILEIPEILGISRACAEYMIEQGIFQWNEQYPSEEAFSKDLEREELYVLETDGKIVGMITLTTTMDDEYIPVKWLTKNVDTIYIHRLGVHPKYQGRGFAQKLMGFAENYAKNKGYTSIRLDTFSQNKRNQKFYEQRGYQKLENIYFPKQSVHPFHCYELVF